MSGGALVPASAGSLYPMPATLVPRHGRTSPLARWFHRYGLLALFGAAWLLACAQIAQGTDLAYVGLVFLFHVLTILCVRTLGGLRDMFGCCVTYLALQSVTICQIAKVVLWQRPDTPLMVPVITMSVMCCGMFGMWLASCGLRLAPISPRFRIPTPTDPRSLTVLAWLGVMFASVSMVWTKGLLSGDASGGQPGLMGIFAALQFVGVLAISAGIGAKSTLTSGEKFLSVPTILVIGTTLLFGILGASRQGITDGVVEAVIASAAFGVKLRPARLISFLVIVWFVSQILFPFALYARSHGARSKNKLEAAIKAEQLLVESISTGGRFPHEDEKSEFLIDPRRRRVFAYYPTREPTLGRYSLIPTIDAMVHTVVHSKPWGFKSILPAVGFMLPGFLRPEHLVNMSYANVASWRIQELQPNDHSTGLTIGFIPDAFSAFGYAGAIVIPALLLFLICYSYRSVISTDLFRNAFACAILPGFIWVFSGAPIAAQIPAVFPGAVVTWLALKSVTTVEHSIRNRRASRDLVSV